MGWKVSGDGRDHRGAVRLNVKVVMLGIFSQLDSPKNGKGLGGRGADGSIKRGNNSAQGLACGRSEDTSDPVALEICGECCIDAEGERCCKGREPSLMGCLWARGWGSCAVAASKFLEVVQRVIHRIFRGANPPILDAVFFSVPNFSSDHREGLEVQNRQSVSSR